MEEKGGVMICVEENVVEEKGGVMMCVGERSGGERWGNDVWRRT